MVGCSPFWCDVVCVGGGGSALFAGVWWGRSGVAGFWVLGVTGCGDDGVDPSRAAMAAIWEWPGLVGGYGCRVTSWPVFPGHGEADGHEGVGPLLVVLRVSEGLILGRGVTPVVGRVLCRRRVPPDLVRFDECGVPPGPMRGGFRGSRRLRCGGAVLTWRSRWACVAAVSCRCGRAHRSANPGRVRGSSGCG